MYKTAPRPVETLQASRPSTR